MITIDGNQMPDATWGRSRYRWSQQEILGHTGTGAPIYADGSTLTIVYDAALPDDWTWWTQTVLGGAGYREFDNATLYDDDGDSREYTHLIVYRPVREKWEMGRHLNATVLITDIY